MDQGYAIVLAALIASAPPTIIGWRNKRTIDDTHRQVQTLNESTIGQLAANTETRRVEAIDHDDRTALEQRHVDDAPPPEPPQGPRN